MTYYAAHLVKITTNSGLFGLGEAYRGAGTLNWIHTIKDEVIGEDPLQVDYLFQKMMEAGSGADARSGTLTGAIAGIESALWDLAGKILNVPAYVLLGGKFRDKLLIYHDTGSPDTIDPGPWVEEAQRSRELGFKAMKFDLNPFRGERWNRTLASGHACMAIRSFVTLESDSVELPYWADIIQQDGSFYKDGYLEIPNKPGLGMELNERVCKKNLAEGSKFFD